MCFVTSRIKLFAMIVASVRRLNLSLYCALLFRLLMPTVYKTFRVSILGSLHDPGLISIASQMEWVSVVLKVTDEALLLPLYHCLGASIDDVKQTRNKVKTGFVVSCLTYVVFSGIVAALADPLVDAMGQSDSRQASETVNYIRMELIAVVVSSLAKFIMTIMVVHGMNMLLYVTLAVQMAASVTLDYLLGM